MSVRYGLLALLSEQPMYGAQLQAEFESRTGGTWPLNVGQVYQTLARLERDGLVQPRDGDAASTEETRHRFGLTEPGRTELERGWQTPADRMNRPRDELTIKLALAVTLRGVDVPALIQVQRHQCMAGLQRLTRLKARATEDEDLAWLLVLDNLLFLTEAEVRWLDHVETRLVRRPAADPADTADADHAAHTTRARSHDEAAR